MSNLIGKVNYILRNTVVFSLVVLMATASAVTAAEVELLPYASDGYKYTSSTKPEVPILPALIDPAYDDSVMSSGQAAFGWGECGSMDYNTQGPIWYSTYFRKWVDLPAGASNVQITVVGPGLDVVSVPFGDWGVRGLYVNGILITEGNIGYEVLGSCDNILEHTVDIPDETINEGANLITIWIQAWMQPWRFDMRIVAEEGGEPTIEELTATVAALDLPDGTKSSLISNLDATLASIEAGKTKTAVNKLNAFKNRPTAVLGLITPHGHAKFPV